LQQYGQFLVSIDQNRSMRLGKNGKIRKNGRTPARHKNTFRASYGDTD